MGGADLAATIDSSQLGPIPVDRVMHRGLFTCRANATVVAAARVMAAHRVHSVVVVDDEGTALAVVTEDDIAAAIYGGMIARPAAEIGAGPVLVRRDDSVLRAAQLMHEHERSHALVVEPFSWKPIGVVSVLDLVDLLAEEG
jgi:predicted transcriptional regulator